MQTVCSWSQILIMSVKILILTLCCLKFQKPGFEDESSFDRSPILRYCAVSSIEHSHKTVVTDITWIPDHMEVNIVQLCMFICLVVYAFWYFVFVRFFVCRLCAEISKKKGFITSRFGFHHFLGVVSHHPEIGRGGEQGHFQKQKLVVTPYLVLTKHSLGNEPFLRIVLFWKDQRSEREKR